MIDKLKLWNLISLYGSYKQYDMHGNKKLAKTYLKIITNIWETLSDEDCLWLEYNAFTPRGSWTAPVARQKEIIDLIIKIGEPEVVYEPLTHQLTLF